MPTLPLLTQCFVCNCPARPVGRKSGFSLYRCPQCLLLFVDPVPDSRGIYSDDYFSGARDGHGYVDYDHDKRAMISSFENYLARIEEQRGAKGRLLDIGAATGFFIDLAAARGWRVSGVEISDYAAGIGRRKGLDIRTGTLESAGLPDQSFDVVTLWDVLEHVPDPRATLRQVWRVLAPGGILALNTPDSGSAVARLLGLNWHLVVPPEHIYLFSRRASAKLLAQLGFEVQVVTTIGKKFTLQYVAHTLAHWQKLALWANVADRLRDNALGTVGVPINLRDNLFLLARRPF